MGIISKNKNHFKEKFINKIIYQMFGAILKVIDAIIEFFSLGFCDSWFSYNFDWWRIDKVKDVKKDK